MMLTRTRFDIHQFDSARLDKLAEFLLTLFELLPGNSNLDARYTLTLNLYGVPARQHAAVQGELEKRLHSEDFQPNPLGPPGACTVVSPSRALDITPLSGLGLDQLEGEPFDGLVLELRFEILGKRKKSTQFDSTIVLVGEIQSGQFDVRAIWREDPFGIYANQFRSSPWPQEAQFWTSFQEFEDEGSYESQEMLKLAKAVFPQYAEERKIARTMWALFVPFRPGHPRLMSVLRRALILGGIACLGVLLVFLSHDRVKNADFLFVKLFWWTMSLFLVGPLLLFLGYEALLLHGCWRGLKNNFRLFYKQETEVVEATPEVIADHTENRRFQQIQTDLLDQGFSLMGHQMTKNDFVVPLLLSTYVDSRTGTEVLLTTIRHDPMGTCEYWPANVMITAKTPFSDESMVVLMNEPGGGWLRSCPGQLIVRYCKSDLELEKQLQMHRQLCEDYSRQHGVTPVHRSYADIARMQKERLHREHEFFQKRLIAMGDIFHFWMQWVRKEYRYQPNHGDQVGAVPLPPS